MTGFRWRRPLLSIEGHYLDRHIRLRAFDTQLRWSGYHVRRMSQTSLEAEQALFPPGRSSAAVVSV